MKDPYSENHKKLMKDIDSDRNKWKKSPRPWVGRTNTVKMSRLPKAIYTFTANSIFRRTKTDNSKTCIVQKRPRIVKAMLKKKREDSTTISQILRYSTKS